MRRTTNIKALKGVKAILVIKQKLFLKACLPAFLISICLLNSTLGSTQNIEFIENKGQWDSSLAFKGTYSAGAIALKPDGGYKIQLNNRDDLKKLSFYMHGQRPAIMPENANTLTKGVATNTVALANNTSTGFTLHSHMYQVSFLHGNPHPIVVTEKKQEQYNNYFIGSNPAKWASKCGIFNAVTFKNVYAGIDVRYYTSGGNFKYDIVVNAGADVSNVALKIEGADSLRIKDGNLIVKTSVDEVKELAPYSYSATSEGNKVLKCRFNLKGSVLTFKFGDAIKPGTALVIDPTVIFCSFSGSTYDNWGYTATYDAAGNFYSGGIVFGPGFPVTPGAFQTNWKGGNNGTGEGDPADNIDASGFDMGIIKFNSTGTQIMYATYIGGSGNEQPHSLVADAAGNLIIAGRSTSSDYPTIAPDTIGKCGNQDIVLSKLSADGTVLIGSLRIGGTGDDGVNIRSKDLQPNGIESTRRNYGDDARSEVILDNQGNICLASCTRSSDFPLYNSLFNSLNGQQDAVLLRFSPNLNSKPLLSTYLGGSGNDAAFVLAQNPFNQNLYVAGATSSTDFPGLSGIKAASGISGVFMGGDCDGFITELTSDGTKLIKSIYYGTGAADQIFGVDFSKSGFPFITGTTEGLVPVVNSPFNASGNQASGKQFITKLQPDLSGVVFSANFGPANEPYPNISPTAFLVDVCENVYVSGWGGGLDYGYANSNPQGLTAVLGNTSAKQLTSSPSSIDIQISATRKLSIPSSFYFFVLEKDAKSQLYGAFLGDAKDLDGIHVDGGTSRFDKSGVIYQAVCACGPDPSLPSANAAQPVNRAYQSQVPYYCNLTSLKIAFNFAGVRAAVKSAINGIDYDTAGCVPLTVTLVDTIGNAQEYIWNFGDSTSIITTTKPTVPHVYTKVGTYKVTLVAVDSTTCNITDTSYLTIRVRDNPAELAFYQARPICDSFSYVFYNNTPPAAKPFTDTSFSWNFGDGSGTVIAGTSPVLHTYQAPGTYTVTLTVVDSNFCNVNVPFTQQLRVANLVKALFTPPAAGCAPYTVQFDNTSSGGEQFFWSFGDNGATSQQQSPTYTYKNPGNYTVKLVVVDSLTCNKIDSATTTVAVYGSPTAGFTYSPQQPQENTPVTLTNTSTGATHYKWDFGDGTTLLTTQDTVVSHIYIKSGTYNICLTAYNAANCPDSACQAVAAIIVPLVDVPNALTPGGANPMIHVKGFGIEKMDWKIFNRWGTMVFESSDQETGWDGRYKGVLQPQEVYVYVLNVEFGDGTKYQKKGDITLLR